MQRKGGSGGESLAAYLATPRAAESALESALVRGTEATAALEDLDPLGKPARLVGVLDVLSQERLVLQHQAGPRVGCFGSRVLGDLVKLVAHDGDQEIEQHHRHEVQVEDRQQIRQLRTQRSFHGGEVELRQHEAEYRQHGASEVGVLVIVRVELRPHVHVGEQEGQAGREAKHDDQQDHTEESRALRDLHDHAHQSAASGMALQEVERIQGEQRDRRGAGDGHVVEVRRDRSMVDDQDDRLVHQRDEHRHLRQQVDDVPGILQMAL
eukprot:scaffold194_cov277-Pinguiococcus_pyrenoidosus.AAC.1